jgi:hypothetical protein
MRAVNIQYGLILCQSLADGTLFMAQPNCMQQLISWIQIGPIYDRPGRLNYEPDVASTGILVYRLGSGSQAVPPRHRGLRQSDDCLGA